MESIEPIHWLLAAALVAFTAVLGAGARLFWKLPKVEKGTVGFFHPFADGGGGGERVLWCAVRAVQCASSSCKVVIYAREGVTAKQLVKDAADRFHIHIDRPIEVVPLKLTHLVLAERYPSFTLIRQALGSMRLGWEALCKKVPEVMIDTTGWAFINPLCKLAGAKVASYVHYPTVSTDMLLRVWSQQSTYNNDDAIARSSVKSMIKVLYYELFAIFYGLVGACADVVMVNSSWTGNHIKQLWWGWSDPVLVYPPCDTTHLQQLPLDRRLKQLYLISVSQFRPEKNHRLQLEAYAAARRNAGNDAAGHAILVSKLKMVGSCRGPDDEARLQQLQEYAEQLELGSSVEWYVNVPFSELKMLLGDAVGGLHTMVDEHFGISVVEYMAAGVIPIANNSAGPKEDIVVPEEGPCGVQITGFLASTLEEYTEAITKVLVMDQRDRLKIAAAAQRRAASMFSTERFHQTFMEVMEPVLP